MERSSFSLLFSTRNSKMRKNGKVPIEGTITVNGQKCSFSTGKLVSLNSWDKLRQVVKGASEEAKSINKFLSAVKARLYEKEAELLDKGFIVTAELLKDAYLDKVERLKERTLVGVLEEHNSELAPMVGTISKAPISTSSMADGL